MNLLVLDTETGGLDPSTCGLTEVAAVICEHGGDWALSIVARFSVLIAPAEGLTYDPEALAKQGRSLEALTAQGVSEHRALMDLRSFIGPHWGWEFKRVVPYGHNVRFDLDFVEAACTRQEIALPFNHSYRCSMGLFRWLKDAGMHDVFGAKLDDVMTWCGVSMPTSDRHTALADAEATAHCIGMMMRRLRGAGRNSAVMGSLFG